MRCYNKTAVSAFLAICTGCASTGFRQVSISAGQDEGDVQLAGHTVFVVPNAQMADTALESRIRINVENALLDQGYVLAPPTRADLYVMASFGAVDRFALSSISFLAPATTRTETAPNGATLRKVYPEHMEHPEILSLKNSLAVLISASDAKLYRETGQVKSLWRAEASMPGKPELLREMVPYMLTPTLSYFGKSSGGLKSVDISDKDIRHWQRAR
ncbi:MAG: hypothetical protein ABIQ55_12385 [Gemmatimonadaceae bacterium]